MSQQVTGREVGLARTKGGLFKGSFLRRILDR
jgi:hypothetical protein